MNHDAYLRARARRGGKRPDVQDPEPEEKPRPLVSQGPRSRGMPLHRQATPDDLIREARRSGGSVWTRIS